MPRPRGRAGGKAAEAEAPVTSPMPTPRGFVVGEWRPWTGHDHDAEVPALVSREVTDERFAYRTPLCERVYGTILLREGRPIAVASSYEFLHPSGGREPFVVDLREDRVGVLEVAGRMVREVWVGYVRSLAIADLVEAVPEAVALVDLLRAMRDRSAMVRTVRTVVRDLFEQEVEVVSVVGLLDLAARFGVDPEVDGLPFWTWASRFPEARPFTDLLAFRKAGFAADEVDSPHARPAPSRHKGSDHPFRTSLVAHFPDHDWVRLRDGSRPVPVVHFDPGDLHRLVFRAGEVARSRGRASAALLLGWMRGALLPRGAKPEFDGREIKVVVHREVPYVWMGSLEDATGYKDLFGREMPIGLVDKAAPPPKGTVEGDLLYEEIDPYDAQMADMLRRHPYGKRGRIARTTAHIALDAVVPTLEAARREVLGLGPDNPMAGAVLEKMARFMTVAVDDIDLYARETMGAVMGCPTESGRRLDVALAIDGERHLVLFDPRCRVPWLTFEQIACVFRISEPTLRKQVSRAKAKGYLTERDVKVVIAKDRTGRRNNISHVRWQAMAMLAFFGHGQRLASLSKFVDSIAIALDERSTLKQVYLLDLVDPK